MSVSFNPGNIGYQQQGQPSQQQVSTQRHKDYPGSWLLGDAGFLVSGTE